ncbi:hypothetical protein [Alkalihalobacillus sp. TS-13]|uniref:hypothetical protein n=1 Tax=Alkalihalobacillus sp. TS-13 TaxID=2842455 RepID=UPI001C868F1F|nr:hypothetical protein [Alkalihalobacillus sp. TS-13]
MFDIWDLVTFILSVISVSIQFIIATLSRRGGKTSRRKLGTLFTSGTVVQLVYICYFVSIMEYGILINPGLSTFMYIFNLLMLYKRKQMKVLYQKLRRMWYRMRHKLTGKASLVRLIPKREQLNLQAMAHGADTEQARQYWMGILKREGVII